MKGRGDTESPATTHFAADLTVFLTEADYELELTGENIHIREELIEEVMQDLYKEISLSTASSTSSSYSSTSWPPTYPPLSASSLPFDVTSESCGASVSNTGSTLMAGVEFVGVVVGNFAGEIMESPQNALQRVLDLCGDGDDDDDDDNRDWKNMDGCDGGKVGDEWLARVLSWDPLELEQEWDLN